MSRAIPASPTRILLVSLDQVGDLVFASALVAPLRARYPGAAITLWCRDYTRDIAALIPGIDGIESLNPFWVGLRGAKRGSVSDLLDSVRAIRATSPDIAVLAAAPWRAAAAVALTRTPVRIGHARRKNGLFLTHRIAAADLERPVIAEEARLLEPLGVTSVALSPRLDGEAIRGRVQEIQRQAGGPIVVLHAFASVRRRCVALREWRIVASTLSVRGFIVVWTGTPTELDEVRRDGPEPRWMFGDQLAGTRLRDAAALLASAALFIGHDSGPLHIANAFGVPAVGVFAPGEPKRTFPQGAGAWRLVERDSPDRISAHDILAAVDELRPAAEGTE